MGAAGGAVGAFPLLIVMMGLLMLFFSGQWRLLGMSVLLFMLLAMWLFVGVAPARMDAVEQPPMIEERAMPAP
jgi:hypothetical protein